VRSKSRKKGLVSPVTRFRNNSQPTIYKHFQPEVQEESGRGSGVGLILINRENRMPPAANGSGPATFEMAVYSINDFLLAHHAA